MTPLDIALLSIAAVCTSALTAIIGSGGGTILIALLLIFMPPAAAIPFHGVVQLASNTSRVWLFRRHMAWPLILRFGALMPFGVAVGLWLFQGMSKETVQILIGFFVLLSLFTRQLKRFRDKDLPLGAFVPLGFVVGALNMIVGVVAPVLGVLIVRKELNKEAIVGTLGFFGLLGNLLKIIGFVLVGFSFVQYGPALAAMIPSVLIGTYLGKTILSRFSEALFLLVFKATLVILAAKLILWDGLMTLTQAG
jgi:uncharacterized membrane protein YfcA